MLAVRNTAMSTSAVATSTSHIPSPSTQEWSHARSRTEPRIGSPERSHRPRLSADGSPRQPTLERDHPFTSIPPSRPSKKKRRSTTLTSIPSRKRHSSKDSALPKSPSVPTFHTKPDSQDSKPALPVPAPESLPATPAPPLLRVPSNASTTDSRSPSQRRAPASHSSYGVETSNGPPPSFTTQRTLSQDRLWKPSPPEKPNVAQRLNAEPFHEDSESASIMIDETVNDQDVNSSQEEFFTPTTPRNKVDGSIEAQDVGAGPITAGHSTETLCVSGEQLTQGLDIPSADEGSRHSGSDDRKSEDLFLSMAQADASGQELTTRSERRKVSCFLFLETCCHSYS